MLSSRRPASRLFLLYNTAAVLACAFGINAVPPDTLPFAQPNSQWPGADLFSDGPPPAVHLVIQAKDLDKLRRDSRQMVPAEVSENDVLYHDVAVHLKGSIGSFRPVSDKPGMTLDFDRFNRGQRFHRLRRIHLNNSVEDPSFCSEALGAELFRAAGIPAPRVTRAIVSLNGRPLGLYVLKEGFTEDFLSDNFAKIGPNLFEPGEGHDVNQHLKRLQVDAAGKSRHNLHQLAWACLEPNLITRWQKLGDTLERDRFVTFMALEVMLGHRDGYCLARNNYRVYDDVDTGKIIFFPHGMDQLFGTAQLPWEPKMAGLVARTLLETTPGREQYRHTFRDLFDKLFKPDDLTNRVQQLVQQFRPVTGKDEFDAVEAAAKNLSQRIVSRYQFLRHELEQPELKEMEVTSQGTQLKGWLKMDAPRIGAMEQRLGPEHFPCLSIVTSSESTASWRTKAILSPGRYRFEGRACIRDVKPLRFGTHQGAGLRVAGQTRQEPDLVGTSSWQRLKADFEVKGQPGEVEFICELRASSGEAWFDVDSLRVFPAP